MNVMLVEGDERTAIGVKKALKDFDCSITPASTPEDCLALAGRQTFDIVLLDLSLTRDCGCEDIIRQLKETQPDMKIITMALQCDRDLERSIRRHGVLFYMTKPISPSLIRELAAHLIKSKRSVEPAPTFAPDTIAPVRRKGGATRKRPDRPRQG